MVRVLQKLLLIVHYSIIMHNDTKILELALEEELQIPIYCKGNLRQLET